MRFDLGTWQRWCDWIVQIREDLSDMVNDHAIFETFRDVVQSNSAWLDELQGGYFIDFIKRGYVTKTVFGVRGHLKSHSDSLSLRRLLEQMKTAAEQITFDFYLERFPREPRERDWQKYTFARFSNDGATVSAEVIEEHLLALEGLNKDIEAMADRSLAHLGAQPAKSPWTWAPSRPRIDGAMTFQDRIARDPAVCAGQPVVRGTRVPVRTILGYLAHGETTARILQDFPSLTEEDVRAVVAFAAASASEDLPAPTPAPHEVKVA